MATPFYAKVSKALDFAVALSLDAHVMGEYSTFMVQIMRLRLRYVDGYVFLMENCA